ncbi:MAG TPA: hypothetical protein VIZ00_07665 [Streptosporangiaceae bacterium]
MPVVLMLAAVVILAGVVVVAMGRGGELALARPDSAAYGRELVTPADMVAFRPPAALLGYSAPVTDDALQRIARVIAERDAELTRLRHEVAVLRAREIQAGGPARPGSYADPGRYADPSAYADPGTYTDLGRHAALGTPAAATSWDVGPAAQPDYGSPLSFGARAAGAGALEQYASELAAADPAEHAESAEPVAPAEPAGTEHAGEQGAAS